MRLAALERFHVDDSELASLRGVFALAAKNVRLELVPDSVRGAVSADSGCYLWLMRLDGSSYKLYIGRTRSLRKRLTDYANGFQIHSPNDFKLRFLQEFIHSVWPAAEFDLHFLRIGIAESKTQETQLVRKYRPLVNSIRPRTEEDANQIREAFRSYYHAAFDALAGDG